MKSSISQQISNFKKVHNLEGAINFVQLYITLADELYGLAYDCYSSLDELPKANNQFEQHLQSLFLNKYIQTLPPTGYHFLDYQWGTNPNAFIIPGYLTDKDEIDNLYPKIAALNLRRHWFSDKGEFKFAHATKVVFRWEQIVNSNLQCYYLEKSRSAKDWEELVKELKKLGSEIEYLKLVNQLEQIHKSINLINPAQLTKSVALWEKTFGTSLPFPIRLLDKDSIFSNECEKKLEEHERKISLAESKSTNPDLTLREYLIPMFKANLSYTGNHIDPTIYIARISGSQEEIQNPHLTIQGFQQLVSQTVAARLRDLYHDTLEGFSKPIKAPKCTAQDIAILSNLMLSMGIVDEIDRAYAFLCPKIKVKHSQSKILYLPEKGTLRSSWDNLKSSVRMKKWISLQKKFEALINS